MDREDVYIYTVVYYSAKKKKNLAFTTTWIDLKVK